MITELNILEIKVTDKMQIPWHLIFNERSFWLKSSVMYLKYFSKNLAWN